MTSPPDLTNLLPFLKALKKADPGWVSPSEADESAPGASGGPPPDFADTADMTQASGSAQPPAGTNLPDTPTDMSSQNAPAKQGHPTRDFLLGLLKSGLVDVGNAYGAEERAVAASGGRTSAGAGVGFLGAQEIPIEQGLKQQQLTRWGIDNQTGLYNLLNLPFLTALKIKGEQAGIANTQAKTGQTQAETAAIPAKTQLEQTQANAARFRVMNGTIFDTAGGTLTPAVGSQATAQDWSDLVDKAIPPGGGNDALNKRTHQVVDFYLKQGNVAGAQKTLTEAGAQIGSIEKETNPQVQQGKVDVATAEGQARANIETAMARGSNAALANVPQHMVEPAAAAAMKAGEDYAAAQAVTQRMQATMAAARQGNVVAYQIIPEEGTLQVTTSQGVHRINQAEIAQYAGGGSLWQRMMGHFGKALTGESIPSSVLDDMAQIQKIQADGSRSKYENSLNVINSSYGSNYKPVNMSGSSSSGPPPGATMKVPGSDGKLHWSDGRQDLGVAQ